MRRTRRTLQPPGSASRPLASPYLQAPPLLVLHPRNNNNNPTGPQPPSLSLAFSPRTSSAADSPASLNPSPSSPAVATRISSYSSPHRVLSLPRSSFCGIKKLRPLSLSQPRPRQCSSRPPSPARCSPASLSPRHRPSTSPRPTSSPCSRLGDPTSSRRRSAVSNSLARRAPHSHQSPASDARSSSVVHLSAHRVLHALHQRGQQHLPSGKCALVASRQPAWPSRS